MIEFDGELLYVELFEDLTCIIKVAITMVELKQRYVVTHQNEEIENIKSLLIDLG